jgi:Outer membrane protein beta-barrel domain
MKSKLTFATLLLLTLAASHSYAQKSMEWGLKAGGNYFKVGGRSFDNTYNLSFSGGAYAEINYNKYFSLQPELLFNQVQCKTSQAFNQIYATLGGVSDQLVTLDYVAVPILLAYKPIPELSILFGPQYSFLLAQTTGLLSETNRNAFSRSDFSLVFGGQLNLGKIKLGLRYQEGLVNVNAINSTDTWRTYGVQLYFAYQIGDRKLK